MYIYIISGIQKIVEYHLAFSKTYVHASSHNMVQLRKENVW